MPSLLGVILLPVLIVRKRFAAAFFALAVTLAFGMYSFAEMKNILLVFAAGGMCLFAALAGVEDKHRFSWRFMIPLGIAAVAHLFLLGYDGQLQLDVRSKWEKLSQLIGRSVEIEDIWVREAGMTTVGTPMSGASVLFSSSRQTAPSGNRIRMVRSWTIHTANTSSGLPRRP